jgi:excisionase family DNA binding protein
MKPPAPTKTLVLKTEGLDLGQTLALIERLAGWQAQAQAHLVWLQQQEIPARDQADDVLLTMPEVATALRISLARGYELIRLKQLPGVKIGRRQVRVRRADLTAYLSREPI